MRYLSLVEVLRLHDLIIEQSGGSHGIRDLAGLESAVALPRQTFGGKDLYPTVEEKAVALGYSLIRNHTFVDGNKRIGHAAMETFLTLNGHTLVASVESAEKAILAVASSQWSRDALRAWVRTHLLRTETSNS